MEKIDLTNCDKEPIHIPGKIQSNGFLIAADKNYIINFCSDNIFNFLPVTAAQLLNQPVKILSSYFTKGEPEDFITNLIKIWHTHKGFEPVNPYPVQIGEKAFNLIICMAGDYFLIEFEPEISDIKSDVQRIIGGSLSKMLADTTSYELFYNTAEQVKKIIGYDRVMIYRFHEDGHGEVIAEAKNGDLKPFMGLHYPASDIPKQARELYKINLTRIIADVNIEPSSIVTLPFSESVSLDLTHSSLRAVSPVHIQYLKNMGVASSFSISLINQNELWGLIACHNYTPRFINYKERDAAKLIGQVLSTAISFKLHEENTDKNTRLNSAVDEITKNLFRNNTIEDALFKYDVALLNAVEATGAVLVFDNQIHTIGNTPDEVFLKALINWLNENIQSDLYYTHRLPVEFPPALSEAENASGLLACRLSKQLKEYVIWFRPEIKATIKWAGDPDKPVQINTGGIMQLSPRKSFEEWSQSVRLSSETWKTEDIRYAQKLKEEIIGAISRKSSEIRLLNEKLKMAYDELDTFSVTISHDLKTPLTYIKSYSQLLQLSFNLDDKARDIVKHIIKGADKMQVMIQEVLQYSSIGLGKLSPKLLDMQSILGEIIAEIMINEQGIQPVINVTNPYNIYADEIMVIQLFTNIIGNAVKYSKKRENAVVTINSKDTGEGIQYTIKDNGIGIDPKEHQYVFELFRRSEKVKEYEGTGVGLAISKKIMEKHRGKIWLESDGETGSSFHIFFPDKSELQNF